MKLITGNTYPVKDSIKALGGRWNKLAKGWEVPEDKEEEAQALVSSAGPIKRREYVGNASRFSPTKRYVSNYARFSSGAEYYVNKRGRCEDAPCCGCCS